MDVPLGSVGPADLGLPEVEAAQLVRRAVRDDPVFGQNEDPAGHFLCLAEVVGGHEDRRAIVGQGLDDVVEAAAGQRVESRGRLVEEEDLRPAHEPGGDVETAPFAARQLPDPLRLLLGQADGAKQVRSRPRARNLGGGEGPVVGTQVVEEFADPPFRVVAPGLQDGPDPGPPDFTGLPRGGAQYLHPPGRGRAQAFEYLDRGGLARAVGA